MHTSARTHQHTHTHTHTHTYIGGALLARRSLLRICHTHKHTHTQTQTRNLSCFSMRTVSSPPVTMVTPTNGNNGTHVTRTRACGGGPQNSRCTLCLFNSIASFKDA